MTEPTIQLPPFQSPLSKEEIVGIGESIKAQLSSTMNQIKQQMDQVKPNMTGTQQAMAGMTQHMQDLPHVMYETIHRSPWPNNLHPMTHRMFPHDDQAYGWFLAEQARATVNDHVWSAVIESGQDNKQNDGFVQEEWFHSAPDPLQTNVFYACGHVIVQTKPFLWLCQCRLVSEQVHVIQSFFTRETSGTGVYLSVTLQDGKTRVYVLVKETNVMNAASANVKNATTPSVRSNNTSAPDPRRDVENVRRALNTLRGIKQKSNVAERVLSQVDEVKQKSDSDSILSTSTSTWSVVEWNLETNGLSTVCRRPHDVHPSVTECSPKHMLVHGAKHMILSRVWSGGRATSEWLVYDRDSKAWIHSWLGQDVGFAVSQTLDASGSVVYILSRSMTHMDVYSYDMRSSSSLTMSRMFYTDIHSNTWPLSMYLDESRRLLLIAYISGQSLRLMTLDVQNPQDQQIRNANFQNSHANPIHTMLYEPKITSLPTFAHIQPVENRADVSKNSTFRISLCGVLFPDGSIHSEWTQPFVADVYVNIVDRDKNRVNDEKNNENNNSDSHRFSVTTEHTHQPWIEWTEETPCTTTQMHHCCTVNDTRIAVGSFDFSVSKKDRDAYLVAWK
jgi:hypothetical protein